MPTNEERREVALRIRKAGRVGYYSHIYRLVMGEDAPRDTSNRQDEEALAERLAGLIDPGPERVCEIDRRDPSNPFCKECGQDWDDDWAYCPGCGSKEAGR